MDVEEKFLLCFQENFHDLPTAIYVDSQKMGTMDVSCDIPYSLVKERGRILGLLPGMGPSIRIRLSILPLLGACVFVTRFVKLYVTYTNTVIGHILWLPLSTISTLIGGYLGPH